MFMPKYGMSTWPTTADSEAVCRSGCWVEPHFMKGLFSWESWEKSMSANVVFSKLSCSNPAHPSFADNEKFKFSVQSFERRTLPVFTELNITMPRHQKVAGYYVIPSEILSVRPSVCLSVCPSVCPSVRPSAPTTILVSATPPTIWGQSFWNFTGVLRMVWRYAYCFFRILKLFFITFFPFLT